MATSSADANSSKSVADDKVAPDESESENEEEEEGSESETSVDPSAQLINGSPLQLDRAIDQPVTSGNDAMMDDGGME